MAIRFISKGKGRKRKSFPIRPKKGVTVRSVSLRPNAVVKVNKEQIRLINKGQPATFSKALNEVITRAKRDGIPIYDTHVNSNDRRKPYHMWIVKHPEKGDKIKGSDTIVMAEHYGQAIDDMIVIWNKEKRKNITIGYPQVQGTAEKSFRFARDSIGTPLQKEILTKLDNRNSVLKKNEIQVMLNTINKDDTSEIAKKFLLDSESAEEGFKITPEQTDQGLKFLMRERSKGANRDQFENSIAGEVIDNFKEFRLRGFREVNLEKGRTIPFYVPQWIVFSNNSQFPEFEYYWEGKLVING